MRWLLVGLALVAATAATAALADELRPGYIELRQQSAERWALAWKQPLTGRGEPRLVVPLIPRHCRLTDGPHQRLAALALVGNAEIACRGTLVGETAGYRAIPGGGDVLLRVAPLGRAVQNYRLTPAAPAVRLTADTTTAQVWRSYGRLGIEHILAGWDHLLFVGALVLLVGRGWAAAKAVTAFTIAHSLTLAGVTLGLVGLPAKPVEVLIALSIVLLAVELAQPTDRPSLTRQYPWAVAFVFGLVHGFGFAGALAEIGVPAGEVPAALLAFNLGVEAGQIAVVLAIVALLAALRRLAAPALAPAMRTAAYAIGVTASYWLVERLVA